MNAIKLFFSEVFKRHTEDDAEAVVIVGAPGTIPDPATLSSECPRPWLYTRVLAFFLLVTVLLFLANTLTNPGQFSSVMVIGAFAVPFSTLVLLFEFNVFRNISFYTILKAVFIGGALSLIVTAVLPSFWFHGITKTSDAFAAGIGEELAKMLVVYWILKRNRAYPYILNGILVGAAVGAGFAIFETAGYAMFGLFGGNNAWLGKDAMTILLIRNLLAPGGHVIWAAISGAGLLMAMRREPLSAKVFGRQTFWAAFLIPITLHVLWDFPLFDSTWAAFGGVSILTLLAWIAVAWFLRRGLEEIDMVNALVPYRGGIDGAVLPAAGTWSRWAARSLDQLVLGVICWAALSRTLGYFGMDGFLGEVGENALGIVAIPLALALEAIVFELFGTTFGKWLFSLRVLDSAGKSLLSGAYARRLLRLWVSGLGLGIPVVSLFTLARQERRVARGRAASYDEKQGISVVRGKFRPLRLLAAVPVAALAMLMGLLAFAGDLDDDPEAESAKSAKSKDERIGALVAASGLKYDKTDDGLFIIGFSLTGGRTQNCLVWPETVEEDGSEYAFVGAFVAPCETGAELLLHETLMSNTARVKHIWGEMENHIVLRSLVPLDTSPTAFRTAVEALAEEADKCEQEITGKDEF